jgi:hypothetical protein
MANRFHMPRAEAQNASGGVLAGGKLQFYESGTSTPLDTYSDDALSSANANPVVADSAGRWGAIFLKDQDYKVVLSDSGDVQISSSDPVRGSNDSLIDDTIKSTLDTTGSANAYALTVNRTMSALANGDSFAAKVNFTNTGSATLAITEAGGTAFAAKTIKKNHDLDLADGDLESGSWHMWKYDGTYMQLLTPTATVAYPVRNLLKNGDFRQDQRRGDGTAYTSATTPANNDDTVLLDRGILLSDGNNVVDVTQETSVVPTGSYAAWRFDVETANKKFGYFQILVARDAAVLISGVGSLSFKARRTGTSIANLRAALVSWDSTADSVTSDPVSAWEAAGTNPTLVANWTYENTPASLAALTTSYQTFKIENISIDTASATNAGLFIWSDDVTTTVGDFLYIADLLVVPGPNAIPFPRRSHAEELALCLPHYEKSYDQGTVPGTSTEAGAVRLTDPVAAGSISIHFKVVKHAAPTMTGYSTTGASGKYRDLTTGADFDITLEDIGDSGCHAAFATSGAIDELKGFHWTAESEL